MSLINNLLETAQKIELDSYSKESTFLEIIGKTYDENLVSRMLLYIIKNDNNFLKGLISKYNVKMTKNWEIAEGEITISESTAEKNMLWGRGDIFIVAKDCRQNQIVLTIENKINAWEHDEQTQSYYMWVEGRKEYKEAYKIYLYLTPSYNISTPSCDKFLKVLYSDLIDIIRVQGNKIIDDFKSHIKECFSKKELLFMEDEMMYLSKQDEINSIISRANDKKEMYKQEIIASIINGLEMNEGSYEMKKKEQDKLIEGTLIIEKADNNATIRFYRKDKWYKRMNQDGYYFYIEILFRNDSLIDIDYQMTVKSYGQSKKNSIVREFFEVEKIDCNYNTYTIVEKEKFNCEHEFLSDEWQRSCREVSARIMSEYLSDMDKLFNRFEELKDELVKGVK